MIKLQGLLAIRTISGRNGDFNVGRLATSIGEFVVKDATLDQYKEGKYQGEFAVTQISPSSYTTSGRTVIEVRARIDSMVLESMDILTPADAASIDHKESDPLDEEPGTVIEPQTDTSANLDAPFGMSPHDLPKPNKAHAGKGAVSAPANDAEIFGTIWPLANTVKLDATVDRQQLRNQCARLNQLGYVLDIKNQVWNLKQ